MKPIDKNMNETNDRKAEKDIQLYIGLLLNNEIILSFEPKFEHQKITLSQINTLKSLGIRVEDVEQIYSKELASLIIGFLITRKKYGLCTFKQLEYMDILGVPKAYSIKKECASEIIEAYRRK